MSDRTNVTPDKAAFVAAADPASRRRDGRFAKGASGNRGACFTKGISGNPSGRPKGSRAALSALLDTVAAEEAADVLAKTIEMAKQGDVAAARLILRRSWPVPKGRPVEGLKLPAITTPAEAATAMGEIVAAVGAGTLSIEEARDLSEIVETFRKVHELVDIDTRLTVLEHARARKAAMASGADF